MIKSQDTTKKGRVDEDQIMLSFMSGHNNNQRCTPFFEPTRRLSHEKVEAAFIFIIFLNLSLIPVYHPW